MKAGVRWGWGGERRGKKEGGEERGEVRKGEKRGEEKKKKGRLFLKILMGLKGINVLPFPETVISNFVYLRVREHATKA